MTLFFQSLEECIDHEAPINTYYFGFNCNFIVENTRFQELKKEEYFSGNSHNVRLTNQEFSQLIAYIKMF